jgi:hypothetical protein
MIVAIEVLIDQYDIPEEVAAVTLVSRVRQSSHMCVCQSSHMYCH